MWCDVPRRRPRERKLSPSPGRTHLSRGKQGLELLQAPRARVRPVHEHRGLHDKGAPLVRRERQQGQRRRRRKTRDGSVSKRGLGCPTAVMHIPADPICRNDFYQTSTSVVASLFLKKIDKATAVVDFQPTQVKLDLRTTDSKRYQTELPLFASIKPDESKFRILGTKLELTLAKADGASWPVLRSDDKPTGEIIQAGRAGMA